MVKTEVVDDRREPRILFDLVDGRQLEVGLLFYSMKQGCGFACIFADPDLAVFLNADPDPNPFFFFMRIRIQLN